MITADELIAFENDIAARFNRAEIRAPIHLYHGNEQQMLRVFERVDTLNDWVCCTWRGHYQALLKGIPRDAVLEQIIQGRSMVMTMPEYRFVSSSIVGGIPSIACGIALGIKKQQGTNRVWCWCGDMSAETGAWHEAYKYSVNHDLPITFVVEDNGLSVLTPTSETWSRTRPWYLPEHAQVDWYESRHLIYYQYRNQRWPHAGAGVRVQF